MEKTKTIDIPHEDVKDFGEMTVTKGELSPEQTAQQEIKKFNLADSAIAALNQKYGELQVKGIEDKAGYKVVREAWSEVRSKRTGLEKKGLELRNGYQAITKAIIKEEKRLVSLLEPLEEKLYEGWKRIDEEKDRIQREEEERAERAFISRLEILQEFGMALRDGFYSLGDKIQLDASTIRSLPEDQFLKLRNRAQEVFEAVKAEEERLEAERIRTIEEERQIKEEFIQKQNELYAAQKKLEEERAEVERERQRVEEKIAYEKAERDLAARLAREGFIASQMEGAGLKFNYTKKQFEFISGLGDSYSIITSFQDFEGKTEDEIIRDADQCKKLILEAGEVLKKQEEEKAAEFERQRKIEQAEAEREKKVGMKDSERFNDHLLKVLHSVELILPTDYKTKSFQKKAAEFKDKAINLIQSY